MTESMMQAALDALYEVAEVSSAGGIPIGVAMEALRLVNPGLTAEDAASVATHCDARGRQVLGNAEFSQAVREVLGQQPLSESVTSLRDLVQRMRQTYRRRYLMYDAPANQCPPALVQNSKAVGLYRELFDVIARGAPFVPRHDLRVLAREILSDYPTDASNMVKAALAVGEADEIGFEEFIMVVQPATCRRPLSDMVRIAKSRHIRDDYYDAAVFDPSQATSLELSNRNNNNSGLYSPNGRPGIPSGSGGDSDLKWLTSTVTAPPPPQGSSPLPLSVSGFSAHQHEWMQGNSRDVLPSSPSGKNASGSGVGGGGGGVGSRPKAASSSSGALSLQHELEQAKQHHKEAEDHFQQAMSFSTQQHMSRPLPRLLSDDATAVTAIPTAQERELSALRVENEALRNKIASLETQLSRRGGPTGGDASLVHSMDSQSRQMSELQAHLAEVEAELRNTRAQLAVRSEASQLIALLKKSNSVQEGLRSYYHDESTLISKHQYLRNISSNLHDGTSPISLVLSQYDLVISGYQAIYRELRKKHDTALHGGGLVGGKPYFDSSAAASSIIPLHTPTRHFTPTRRMSPAKAVGMPLKWQDLDSGISHDMKRTGTLQDPLLTDEERHQLRAKLAAKMRGAARSYTPTRSRSTTSNSQFRSDLDEAASINYAGGGGGAAADYHDDEVSVAPGAATIMASHEAVGRLQHIANRAIKHRRL